MSAIDQELKRVLKTGFREDFGFGDLTSNALESDELVKGAFICKKDGFLSGVNAISTGYGLLDESINVTLLKSDGDPLKAGDLIAKVEGPAKTLLSGERVILNILQHMSGIATKTAEAVKNLGGSDTRICDTRKTLPGLRALQKYAVTCGGGYNHRMRLDDGVMIKDNHITAWGSIRQAVAKVRESVGLMVKIEVECETKEQVQEAVEAGADIIMLDNKNSEQAAELCKLIPDSVIIELSGGITPETVGFYKDCGADYISLGSLTHSVTALDISFILEGSIKSAE